MPMLNLMSLKIMWNVFVIIEHITQQECFNTEQTEGVWEQGAKNVWIQEGGSSARLEKTAQWGASL
jgi:hypothetical protein